MSKQIFRDVLDRTINCPTGDSERIWKVVAVEGGVNMIYNPYVFVDAFEDFLSNVNSPTDLAGAAKFAFSRAKQVNSKLTQLEKQLINDKTLIDRVKATMTAAGVAPPADNSVIGLRPDVANIPPVLPLNELGELGSKAYQGLVYGFDNSAIGVALEALKTQMLTGKEDGKPLDGILTPEEEFFYGEGISPTGDSPSPAVPYDPRTTLRISDSAPADTGYVLGMDLRGDAGKRRRAQMKYSNKQQRAMLGFAGI